jgi:hypothetical protein
MQHNIPAILVLRPVHYVVLAVEGQVESANWHAFQKVLLAVC